MDRITFFVGSLSGGGSERVCVNLANALVEKNWKVDLIVLNMGDSAYRDLLDTRVNLTSLDVCSTRYAFIPLYKIIKKLNVQTIVSFSYELTVLLILLKNILFLRIKIIARNVNTFSRNVVITDNFWRDKIVLPLINALYGKADFYINQCNGMQNDLVKAFPDIKTICTVINNPINEELFSLTPPDVRSETLLCVGRLESQKCFSHAIKAFSIVIRKYPSLKLKIVGKGSLEPNLKELATSLRVAESVIFEGFKKNIDSYYLSSRATILTSKYEGFPNVLLESIALGTPVVAHDCPSGPKEIIVNGVNGFLADYMNIDDLAAKIMVMLETTFSVEQLRMSVGKYRKDKIIDKYIKCFQQVHDCSKETK